MRILLVCLGNICRSPTAEAALREALGEAGLDDQVTVESAGTGDWHVGQPRDRRMVEAAAAMGLTVDGLARLVDPGDFERYDLILAMDRANFTDLHRVAPNEDARRKIRLFRSFEEGADSDEVPDPYYGGEESFRRVVDIARAGAKGVVAHVRAQLAAGEPRR